MGAVLPYCRDPLRIVDQCGKRAKTLVIVAKFHPDLEGAPVCGLPPMPGNFLWHTWWHFRTQFFAQFLAVMGFVTSEPATHQQFHRGRAHPLYGRVARPSEAEQTSQTPYNNSLTRDFSSFNSTTDASILERLKSLIGSPCTISHFPARTRTGNDEINPFSTS